MKLSLAALSRWSSTTTVVAGVVGVAVILFALSRLGAQYEDSREAAEVSLAVEGLAPLGLQLGQATRNVMLNPTDQKAAANHEQARKELEALFRRLGELTRADDLQPTREPLQRLETQLGRDVELQRRAMGLATAGRDAEARAFLSREETPLWRAAKETIAELKKLAAHHAEVDAAQVLETQARARWTLWGLGVLLVTVPLVSAWANRRGVAGAERSIASVRDIAQQLAGATRVVSESSHALANATSGQAATNEETRAALISLSTQVKGNAADAVQAREFSRLAREGADEGEGEARDLSTAIAQLQESSREVHKVLKTIDDIAFQTNLLALNAAVEAARAGDAGAGFAVVAEEVRALALRSAQAAQGTQDTLEESLRRTEKGAALVGRVSRRLSGIAARAHDLDRVSARVAAASEEQRQAVTQLEQSMASMERVVQQTTAEAEAGASAAEELTSQSAALEGTVAELSLTVSG